MLYVERTNLIGGDFMTAKNVFNLSALEVKEVEVFLTRLVLAVDSLKHFHSLLEKQSLNYKQWILVGYMLGNLKIISSQLVEKN